VTTDDARDAAEVIVLSVSALGAEGARLALASSTRPMWEASMALAEGLARLRFAAGVLAEECAAQAPVPRSTPSTPPTPLPKRRSAARRSTGGDAGATT